MDRNKKVKPEEPYLTLSERNTLSSQNSHTSHSTEYLEIKKILSQALDKITALKDENEKIRQNLETEYKEKISSLENEVIYLNFLLKNYEQYKSTEKLESKISNLKNICLKKDKIIEFQEQRLKDIEKSIKSQVREVRNLVESKSLYNSNPDKEESIQNTLQVFWDFFKFSKDIGIASLCKIVESVLGPAKKIFEQIQKRKTEKIIKNLLNLCKEFLTLLHLTANKSQNKDIQNTHNDRKKDIFIDFNENFLKELNRKQTTQEKNSQVLLNSKNSIFHDRKNPFSKLNKFNSCNKVSELKPDSFKALDRKNFTQIDEEISIVPKDYSSLYQEGERLIKIIDNQNVRLSKLSREIGSSFEFVHMEESNNQEKKTENFTTGVSREQAKDEESIGIGLRVAKKADVDEEKTQMIDESGIRAERKRFIKGNKIVSNKLLGHTRAKIKN